jgi:hypothetical protein
MTYAFDLDGTLIDTKEAVVQAYRIAGVEMPEDAWGKPWHEWLKDETIHHKKNEVYPDMLKQFASVLPLFTIALRLNAPVITGASNEAVIAIQSVFGSLNIVGIQCSRLEKILWLNRQRERGCYVDDDDATLLLVKEFTTWKPLTPNEALQLLS